MSDKDILDAIRNLADEMKSKSEAIAILERELKMSDKPRLLDLLQAAHLDRVSYPDGFKVTTSIVKGRETLDRELLLSAGVTTDQLKRGTKTGAPSTQVRITRPGEKEEDNK